MISNAPIQCYLQEGRYAPYNLYKTDGTSANSKFVTNTAQDVSWLSNFNGKLIFSASGQFAGFGTEAYTLSCGPVESTKIDTLCQGQSVKVNGKEQV